MRGQLSIFDIDPRCGPEPAPGEWVKTHGPVICHIMRRGYIGRKVVIDQSEWGHVNFLVGILERVETSCYYRGDQKIECDMSVVNVGSEKRFNVIHWPGNEIFELYPFDWEERTKKKKGEV